MNKSRRVYLMMNYQQVQFSLDPNIDPDLADKSISSDRDHIYGIVAQRQKISLETRNRWK